MFPQVQQGGDSQKELTAHSYACMATRKWSPTAFNEAGKTLELQEIIRPHQSVSSSKAQTHNSHNQSIERE